MVEKIVGFTIWSVVGIFFICLGVYAMFTRKLMKFWANAEMFEVTDVKKYNYAVAKLFIIFKEG